VQSHQPKIWEYYIFIIIAEEKNKVFFLFFLVRWPCFGEKQEAMKRLSDRQYSECADGGVRSGFSRNLAGRLRFSARIQADLQCPVAYRITIARVGAITTHFDLLLWPCCHALMAVLTVKAYLRRIPDGGIVRALPELSKVRGG
jgi:hypothetical protein